MGNDMKSIKDTKNSLAMGTMVLLAAAAVFTAGTMVAPLPAVGEEIQSSIARWF